MRYYFRSQYWPRALSPWRSNSRGLKSPPSIGPMAIAGALMA